MQDMSSHLDRQNLRKQMGFCLQENVYYEDLTLNDHLEFIGRLRDIPPAVRAQQVCRHDFESYLFGFAACLLYYY
jgi:ABC-type multidrug transport system ATPase subunit